MQQSTNKPQQQVNTRLERDNISSKSTAQVSIANRNPAQKPPNPNHGKDIESMRKIASSLLLKMAAEENLDKKKKTKINNLLQNIDVLFKSKDMSKLKESVEISIGNVAKMPTKQVDLSNNTKTITSHVKETVSSKLNASNVNQPLPKTPIKRTEEFNSNTRTMTSNINSTTLQKSNNDKNDIRSMGNFVSSMLAKIAAEEEQRQEKKLKKTPKVDSLITEDSEKKELPLANHKEQEQDLLEKKESHSKNGNYLDNRPTNDTIMLPQNNTAIQTIATQLNPKEIADLQKFHDNSLADNSRKAYLSDFKHFMEFLSTRFPTLKIQSKEEMTSESTFINTSQCTLEHVLSYLNQMCNDGKKISTINRRLSAIKKHILPSLFSTAVIAGSRQELMLKEMEAIVKGIRRTIKSEQRVRGKQPLLIEHIRAMVDIASAITDAKDKAMPNKQSRDKCLLLFLFFSAMRRAEVQNLSWTDLTFDHRGVTILIRKSKTDQEGKGQTIAIPRIEGTYCPVKALEEWKEISNGVGESPVFRWISLKDEIQWRILVDQRIVGLIKYYATEIGLDPMLFSAHSTRSGYVSSCSDRGLPISEMMKRTRHKSISSLQVYMKSADLFKDAGDAKL